MADIEKGPNQRVMSFEKGRVFPKGSLILAPETSADSQSTGGLKQIYLIT